MIRSVSWLWSRAIVALVLKELNQIRRDRRIVIALVVPPILQLMIFGTVMSPDVTGIRLGVVDDSRSPQSRGLVAALSESGSFRLDGMFESVDALGEAIRKDVIDAGVVVPGGLARDLERGRSSTVQVLLNAMNANTAAVSQGYVQGVVQSFNASTHCSCAHQSTTIISDTESHICLVETATIQRRRRASCSTCSMTHLHRPRGVPRAES